MIERLKSWARGRQSRPGLLVRRSLGVAEPGDEALALRLADEFAAAPVAPGLAALAWRTIESMDLGPAPVERVEALFASLGASPAPTLPLILATGARIDAADAAQIAAEALALRALTKAHWETPEVVAMRDEMARRGPGFEGATRRASALHGIAAAAVHYPTSVAKLCGELASVQRVDGGWGEDDLFHVGQALLAVEHPEATRALGRGVAALAERQEADGGFGNEERSWIACRWLRRLGG